MNRTLATARRVLHQVEHDHRTLALILFMPCILVIILRFVMQNNLRAFNGIAPMILGIFPMIVMFLVTSIATLRERTTGTLERLMVMPVSKLNFVFGYAIAFGLLALIQAIFITATLVGLLDVPVRAGVLPLLMGAVAAAFLGTALGLLVSAFATTEFQAVQFMPAFLIPQLLICGLFTPIASMAWPLQWLSKVAPITYSVDAMKQITLYYNWTATLTRDLIIVATFGVLVLTLGAITIRRQT